MSPRYAAALSGLALALVASPAADAHDYFLGKGKNKTRIFVGSQIDVQPGSNVVVTVEDGGDCRADVTATVSDPSIASVDPSGGFGKRVVFDVEGLAPGTTTLTFQVTGEDVSLDPGDEDEDEVCLEQSTNPFTLCVSPGAETLSDELKALEKEFKSKKKEFKKTLKGIEKDLKNANKGVLGALKDGQLTLDAACDQLTANGAERWGTYNQRWSDCIQSFRDQIEVILEESDVQECAPGLSELLPGGGGFWDEACESLRQCIIESYERMQKQVRKDCDKAARTKPSGVNDGPGQTGSTLVTCAPGSGVAIAPPGVDEDPPMIPTQVAALTANRTTGQDDGKINLIASADAGKAGSETVNVRLRGPGVDENVDVVILPGGLVITSFCDLASGVYRIELRYSSANEKQFQTFISVP